LRYVLSKKIFNTSGTGTGYQEEGTIKITAQRPSQVLYSLFSRALQSSVEKKKNTVKGTTNKDNRIAPIYKPSETATKPNRAAYEPLSLFNN